MDGVISNRSLIAGGLLLAILCSVLFFPSPGVAASDSPAGFTGQDFPSFPHGPGLKSTMDESTPRAYLPLLLKCYKTPAGIYGYVTKAGTPAGGVTIKLIHRSGSTDHDEATTVTDACGYYSFANIPTISQGTAQGYFAKFYNIGIPGCLLQWQTQIVQSYTLNQVLNIGNFDIGDIALLDPTGDVPLPLPVTFHWTARSQSPSDSYIFYLVDPLYNQKFKSDPLGFTDNVQIKNSNLPPDMVSGNLYYWYISIAGPGGSNGLVSQMQGVRFLIP